MRPVLGITCCNRAVGDETAQAVINRYVAAAMQLRRRRRPAGAGPARPDERPRGGPAPRRPAPDRQPVQRRAVALWRGRGRAAGPFDPGRDAMTFALIEAMIELGRPVFGVCRGFEELNVAFGGTLRRDGRSRPTTPTTRRTAPARRPVRPSTMRSSLTPGGDPGARPRSRPADGQFGPLSGASTGWARASPSRPPRPTASSRRSRPGERRPGAGRAVAPRVAHRRQPRLPDLFRASSAASCAASRTLNALEETSP